jgi:hypothetical protein
VPVNETFETIAFMEAAAQSAAKEGKPMPINTQGV